MKKNIRPFLIFALFLSFCFSINHQIIAQSDFHTNYMGQVQKKISERTYFRISLEGQLYGPSPTQYDIERVDSFSLKGSRWAVSPQLGIKAEIIDPKSDRWTTVISLGFGGNTVAHKFSAPASFTRDTIALTGYLSGGPEGLYVLPAIGIGYKHPFGKTFFQHTFSTSLLIPVLRDPTETASWEATYGPDFSQMPFFTIDFSDAIFYQRTNFERDGTNQVLFGFEYQPEWLLRLNKPVFWAVGLIFNYSMGVVSRGDVRVSNARTTYNGTLKQGFSKIGISTRIGFNSNYTRKPKS